MNERLMSELNEWAGNNFLQEPSEVFLSVLLPELNELYETDPRRGDFIEKLREEGGDVMIALLRTFEAYNLDPVEVLESRWSVVKKRKYLKFDGIYKEVEPVTVSHDETLMIGRLSADNPMPSEVSTEMIVVVVYEVREYGTKRRVGYLDDGGDFTSHYADAHIEFGFQAGVVWYEQRIEEIKRGGRNAYPWVHDESRRLSFSVEKVAGFVPVKKEKNL